ncbi:hypothetical protein EMIT0P395_240057 [Pseudomonas sp. IT-P395]
MASATKQHSLENRLAHVGAAEGCDLLILLYNHNIKRSQPSAAAPTESCTNNLTCTPMNLC